MGKQVNFFMTYIDELNFVSALEKEFGPIAILKNTSRVEREVIFELSPVDIHSANLSIVRMDDLNEVYSSYVAKQNVFCIDLINSKIVQFNRCNFINGWLAPGRLWFEGTTGNGKKSADFLAWANKLILWVKKNYSLTEDGYYLVGPDAKKISSSGVLTLGPPK